MKLRTILPYRLRQRKAVTGYLFISPFIVGFFLFFLYPFTSSVIFSLSKLEMASGGYRLIPVGLANYRHALVVHPTYVRVLLSTIRQMLLEVPLILSFSFLMAAILNQPFKGRTLARVIFFLPVILGAGVVLEIENTDYMTMILETGANRPFFTSGGLQQLLLNLRLPAGLINFIIASVNRIPGIIRASGIQILILLAGLQSIPPSLFEAATVEGGTPWQTFWMITFPLMTPILLAVGAYTVIDSFTSVNNSLVALIRNEAFGGSGYGVSTAMATMYFAAIALILWVIMKVVSSKVLYRE
jgi:ABC-type sugar transport system permease subunit